MSYSPRLRTAVLLSGTGTAGAYHAGVLRALHEAGVKIDVCCGRGVGAVGALFAAIDASPKTWEDGGVWRSQMPVPLYRWRPVVLWSALLVAAAAAVLIVPLLVLATGLIAYPFSFLVQMISVDSGHRIAAGYASWIASAFSPGALPTIVPRLITLLLIIAVVLAAVAGVRARRRGRWWPELTGSPWTAEPGLHHVQGLLWQLFRGPTTVREPPPAEFSRRYAELLAENLGQPGFRELIIATIDLETRSDLIFASLSGARRQPFFHRRGVSGELIDLAGAGRSHVLDALAGALTPPALCEPHAIQFSPESYWKGETHRITDRPAAIGRLMIELAAAGVEQVIVVSAVADRSAPHRLGKLGVRFETRLAEHLAAHEAAAVRDGIVAHSPRFSNVFLIQPAHNPVGPFDFSGSYDERSDRFQGVRELVDRGYQDAYRQFIEPVVGGEST